MFAAIDWMCIFVFSYIFLEFSNPHEAIEAVKSTNGYKLDKSHTFVVNLFSDFEKYASVPDEWEPPTPTEYKDTVSYTGRIDFVWLIFSTCLSFHSSA